MEIDLEFMQDLFDGRCYCPCCGDPKIEYVECKGLGGEPGVAFTCDECGAYGNANGNDEAAATAARRDAKGT